MTKKEVSMLSFAVLGIMAPLPIDILFSIIAIKLSKNCLNDVCGGYNYIPIAAFIIGVVGIVYSLFSLAVLIWIV